jgi:type II secretory pathway predicted ATPase ExeA
VDTINYSRIATVLSDAQESSLFLAISYRAGSGKSTAAKAIAEERRLQSVYLLQCREWGKREFLNNLCRCLGIELPRGHASLDELLQKVAEFFRNQSGKKPLLILDEADKLKQASLRTLIPLYNETEGILGCVILGTDHLQKDIKRGARMNQKGYDEIDSRFGRKFIELQGATLADVRAICGANGVPDAVEQKVIFDGCEPVIKQVAGRDIKVVEDLRAVKRGVQKALLLSSTPTLPEGEEVLRGK